MKRGEIFSLLLGLLLGLTAGVAYSWVVNPLSYNETTPHSLREGYRQEYFLLTALSFSKSGDVELAQHRLSTFTDIDLSGELSRMAQTSLADGHPVVEARSLAQLAAALTNPMTMLSTAVTATPTPSSTPEPALPTKTFVPVPTLRPSATPGTPYELVSRIDVCDPDLTSPLIMLYVRDADGSPIPGIEALVIWDAGEDHFFTGLKPELGLDYGDFTLTPGILYQLELIDGQYPISNLSSSDCMDETGQSYPGSVELIFQQPPP